MRHVVLASSLIAAASVWVACSSSSNNNPPPAGTDGGSSGGDSGAGGAVTPAMACTDSIDSVYADPGTLPDGNGTIIKCAHDTDISATDLQAKAAANVSGDAQPVTNTGYDGKPFTSGAHIYRIQYRTERGDVNNSPGWSSAKVFLPDHPRAGALPVVVGARGSRGQAPNCAASKEDPSASLGGGNGINGDYEALAYPLVGAGLAIIIPDLAGYDAPFEDPKNPISAYALAGDVGKGTLDGARAMSKLVTSGLSNKVVLVGHSQGGHSALASLAIQPTYAPELNIAAIATYAPLWISQRTWGSIFFLAGSYSFAANPGANAVSIWYHYTHAELLDGPGHGVDVFAASKQAQIKHFVENDCWGAWDDLQAMGTTANDVFDPAFIQSIKLPAIQNKASPCPQTDAVCQKWLARYDSDRPHLQTNVPMLIEYGSADQTIPPDRMACVIDRLKNQDHVPFTFCLNDGYGHGSNVRHTASYVADWIAAQTLGEAAPPACAENETNLVNDAGAPITCATPPYNNE